MKLIRMLSLATVLAVIAVAALYVFAPVQFTDAAMRLERSLAGLQRREMAVEGLHIAYLDSGFRRSPGPGTWLRRGQGQLDQDRPLPEPALPCDSAGSSGLRRK
jgi:hypothetical protein